MATITQVQNNTTSRQENTHQYNSISNVCSPLVATPLQFNPIPLNGNRFSSSATPPLPPPPRATNGVRRRLQIPPIRPFTNPVTSPYVPVPTPYVNPPIQHNQLMAPAPRRAITRVTIPWQTKGVSECAVEICSMKKNWIVSTRKELIRTKKLMQTYKDGVYIFVETIKRRLGITLTKSPSWQTIRNGAVRALMTHKAYRNGERRITGGGDRECHLLSIMFRTENCQ